MVTTCWLSTQL